MHPVLFLFALAASQEIPMQPGRPQASFDADVEFLREHADVVVFHPESGGWIAVSPRLSGRVMTSAFARTEPGLGLVNREAILAGPLPRGFSNYGGEDRLWLAPEGGPFALYFDPGDPQDLEHWYVPQAFDALPRTVAVQTPSSITFRDRASVPNAAGARFEVFVERTVTALERGDVERLLERALPASVETVAFESVNRVENRGEDLVPHARGLLSVWILGQFQPAPGPQTEAPGRATHVYLPARGGAERIRRDYFGVVPPERLEFLPWPDGQGVTARFRADSALRSKIGVDPAGATGWLGAFQPEPPVLTLVRHSLPGPDGVVPDTRWLVPNPEAARGDVATSYNHGGEPRFFELESLSEALAPEPWATVIHRHATLHLRGELDALRELARTFLHVELPPE